MCVSTYMGVCVIIIITRKHSSRMHTVHCSDRRAVAEVFVRGVSALGGVSARGMSVGGVCPVGLCQTLPLVNRMTDRPL